MKQVEVSLHGDEARPTQAHPSKQTTVLAPILDRMINKGKERGKQLCSYAVVVRGGTGNRAVMLRGKGHLSALQSKEKKKKWTCSWHYCYRGD